LLCSWRAKTWPLEGFVKYQRRIDGLPIVGKYYFPLQIWCDAGEEGDESLGEWGVLADNLLLYE
jgi:hypothetical protein